MPNPTVPKIWPGATIAIAASGPSLNEDDLDYARERGARVVAVNDGVRMAPWADVLYSSDRYWYPHYKGVPGFTNPKYGLGTSVGKRNEFHNLPDVIVLRNTGDDGLELDPGGLRNGRNSGYAAINLAVHLGAAKIILLGFNGGQKSGQSHFFGDHPSGLTHTSENVYATFRRLYKTLVEPLKSAGIEIVNCTDGTRIDAFPVARLRETL